MPTNKKRQPHERLDRRQILQATAATLAALAARPVSAATQEQAPAAQAPARVLDPLTRVVNLHDFEPLARRRVTQMAYDYVAGGGADEITLRRNREQFDSILLKPRVLIDVSKLDTRTEVLGQPLAHPVLLAPTAYHKLMHRDGELGTARGAGATQTTMCVSSFATTAIEKIAATKATPLWFQLYVQPDRTFTKDLVQRAEAAGCRALVITVDTPVLPTRDRETRARFELPPGIEMENLSELMLKHKQAGHRMIEGIYAAIFEPRLTWEMLAWLRSLTRLPVILKGVLAPEDARRAASEGASSVLVSNHGGRNLDTAPATIEALPRVVEAVEGRIPVLLDGGVRRGTDVVKALALGAKAVLIGRPYLWALGVGGAQGVAKAVTLLRTELEAAMALCGTPKLADIDRNVLWR